MTIITESPRGPVTESLWYAKHVPSTLKLSESQLVKLSTKRLLGVLAKTRAFEGIISRTYGDRCCDYCREYIGGNWDHDVGYFLKPIQSYKGLVKQILSTREHVKRL